MFFVIVIILISFLDHVRNMQTTYTRNKFNINIYLLNISAKKTLIYIW